jgi:hypothetical protein
MALDYNKDLSLYNVYELNKIYTSEGPDYSEKNISFRLLIQLDGKGVNWTEMVNRGMTFYMVAHREEIDHMKLRTASKLVLADDLWTCKCKEGRYIHRKTIPICSTCNTVRQHEWDNVIFKEKQKEWHRASKMYPHLCDIWNYEKQDFEMNIDQFMALTFGSWILLEPIEEGVTVN